MPMASAHTCLVSIHTPLAGSDFRYSSLTSLNVRFKSTLPLRGVTCSSSTCSSVFSWFQSTLPLRGVTIKKLEPASLGKFQSTLPLRGVTKSID